MFLYGYDVANMWSLFLFINLFISSIVNLLSSSVHMVSKVSSSSTIKSIKTFFDGVLLLTYISDRDKYYNSASLGKYDKKNILNWVDGMIVCFNKEIARYAVGIITCTAVLLLHLFFF